MRQASLFVAVAITSAVALDGTAFAQAVGSWKFNLAKSNYEQGQAPKSALPVYEAVGPGIKVTVDQVPADGPASHYTVAVNYDGKDVAVVGSAYGDTVARPRVNATTAKLVYKKDESILSTMTLSCPPMGKR
jgi:ABC-type glycerol-3-phosphate transport system substrate-binding protein